MFGHIIVGFDGSPGARLALDAALTLALEYGAAVTVVTVQHHLPRYGATVGEVDEEHILDEQQARQLTNEAQAHADEKGVRIDTQVRFGHAAHELVGAAEKDGADLVILGHRGHSAVWGRFVGSTAERVSRLAPCSVLIVR